MESVAIGFGIGVGIIFGLIFCFALVILALNLVRKKKPTYDEEKLVKAFSKYRKNLQEDERYGEIPEVMYIIQELQAGNFPDEVYTFNIKRKKDIAIKEGDENSFIRMIEHYIIVGKKDIK